MDTPAGTFPDVTMSYQSTNCFHCDNPPCVKACPTQATYKMPNGIVNVNYERCIGCRYCMVACPYDNRVFNWRKPVQEPPADVAVVGETPARPKGVVEKCTFCVQRVTDGLLPRCVVVCPTGRAASAISTIPTAKSPCCCVTGPRMSCFPSAAPGPACTISSAQAPTPWEVRCECRIDREHARYAGPARGSRGLTVWFVALIALVLLGFGVWIYQLAKGLQITNMRDNVIWGLYIITFMFFVGLSAGGLIIASAGRLFGVERFAPIVRLAIVEATVTIATAPCSSSPTSAMCSTSTISSSTPTGSRP